MFNIPILDTIAPTHRPLSNSYCINDALLSKKALSTNSKKYSQESEKERIRGNIIVALYVSISFLSIFVVTFFIPGKL